VLVEVQLKQSELAGPEHVPQAASQGWQTLLPSAYLATGRHEARHVPGALGGALGGALKKGWEVAHATHSSLAGPEHVAHDAWHATHVSLELALPPEQV